MLYTSLKNELLNDKEKDNGYIITKIVAYENF